MSKVVEIKPSADRAEEVMAELRQTIDIMADILDHDMAGFAIVAWDMRGEPATHICATHGMVSPTLVPAFAHDTFNRYLVYQAIADDLEESPGCGS